MTKNEIYFTLIILVAIGQRKGTVAVEISARNDANIGRTTSGNVIHIEETAARNDTDVERITVRNDRNIDSRGYTIHQPGCQIPKLDIFSPTVLQYYHGEPNYQCDNRTVGEPRPALVREYNNNLYFDHSSLKYYGNPNVSCAYQSFERQPTITDDVRYSPITHPLSLDSITKITSETDEFVTVTCRDTSTDQIIYKDYFAFLPPKQAVEERCHAIARENKADRINAIIIGLDSLSRIQFQREMPRSFKFLREQMGGIEMQGYNKVAENTYPNLVPLLTGLSADQLNESCLSRDEGRVDTCPLIWKHFHKKGFRTVFVEDAPDLAIFHWGAKGFVDSPTDYYLRPFYLQSERNIGFNSIGCGFRCLGSRPSMEFLLNHAYKTARIFAEENYFGFFWSCSDTHDTFNYPTRDDDMVFEFLSTMKHSGLLNNTVLIVMSDHGPRLVNFKQTVQGQYEKRLPLLTFAFPQWFDNKYSLAMANLRSNAQMLTTHFDLHKTLFDFTDLSELTDKNLRRRYGNEMNQGQSLFLPISEQRNCDSAKIPKEFCACNGQGNVNASGLDEFFRPPPFPCFRRSN